MEKSFREMTNVPVTLLTFHKMSFTEAQPYSSKLFVEQIHTYEKEIIQQHHPSTHLKDSAVFLLSPPSLKSTRQSYFSQLHYVDFVFKWIHLAFSFVRQKRI